MSKTGPTYPVTVKISHYTNNNTLAVMLVEAKAPWEIFAVITVNMSGSPYGDGDYQSDTKAYLDTNNCPWAEDFVNENGIAKPLNLYGMSGYCTYPLYEFDLNSIWE